MKLLIDVGNTRIKWVLLEKGHHKVYGQCLHQDFESEFEPIGAHDLEGVYCISVASSEFIQHLHSYVTQRWGLSMNVLKTAASCCGITNGYDEPAQLGVDRWAGIIAARQLFSSALCVVDCGSAVTIDAVASDGRHLGGYIVPGVSMQQSLLKQGTAGVDAADGPVALAGWGRNTSSCVARGSVEAIASLIDRSHQQLTEQLDDVVTTVVTGGDAMGILPLLDVQAHHEEHLVLSGMVYMLRELEE